MDRNPRRQGAQAVVEFGIVALIFVLILMGIFDFGLLMNAWLGVSSSSGDLVRRAAVGVAPNVLATDVTKVLVPGSSGPAQLTLWVRIQCPSGCNETNANGDLWAQVDPTTSTPPYLFTGTTLLYQTNGTIVSGTIPSGSYTYSSGPNSGKNAPVMGDLLKARVTASKFEVETPLVRPFFGCAGNQAHCYVPLQSDTNARFEGAFVPS